MQRCSSRSPKDNWSAKLRRWRNLLRSITGSYLHFNHVGAHPDLDPNDGAAAGRSAGRYTARFAKAPDFGDAFVHRQ